MGKSWKRLLQRRRRAASEVEAAPAAPAVEKAPVVAPEEKVVEAPVKKAAAPKAKKAAKPAAKRTTKK